MVENKSKYTFWQIISKYSIQIPIIQRDYAQGRIFERVTEIRHNFLDNLYTALNNDEHLNLDFVYGSIRNQDIFIPLDGQQRLTTLFLLHWYLAVKENNICKVKHKLLKFTYETRASSREFCNSLVNDENIFQNIDFSIDIKISDTIRNSHWFFISWDKDPTIKSMLVMLDDIHMKFKKSCNLFSKLLLEDNAPIYFQFIELEKFGLEDSLYIKMNARGKALTTFENFKAKLQQHLQYEEKEGNIDYNFVREFSNKMDGEWTDLFWNYRDNKSNLFDKQIMNFINAIIINDFALRDSTNTYRRLNYLINSGQDISFYKYMEYECLNKDVMEQIMVALDILKNGEKGIKEYMPNKSIVDEEKLFKRVITNSSYNITYYERIVFFAITQYFITNKENINSDEFYEWIRVIRNLSINTICNNTKEFIKSIQSIKELLAYSRNIINYISNIDNNVSHFLRVQIEEERIKALLILKGSEWKELVTKAENHGYFKGQIGFILKFSDILDSYNNDKKLEWSKEDNDKYYKKFTAYFEKSSSIFNNKGLNVNSNLWRRALLCKGDYLISKGRNLSFLIDSDRDISWKKLLRDNNQKRDYVKELLDSIDINNIQKSLEDVINNNTVTDWRLHFIKIPEILDVCGKDKFIRKASNNNILLLNSSTTAGYCNEYYSYALYHNLKNYNTTKIYYQESRGIDNDKYINILKDNRNIKIKYIYLSCNKWSYVIESDIETKYFEKEYEIIEYLEDEEYIIDSNKSTI